MIDTVDVPKINFSQWIAFTGEISLGDHRTAINFQARIDETGKVAYLIEKMALNASNRFIYRTHGKPGSQFEQFILHGRSESEVRFETDNLIFTAMNSSFGEVGGDWFQPIASSSLAKFFCPIKGHSNLLMMIGLRGFQGFHALNVECALGTIAIIGPKEIDNPNLLNGALQLTAMKAPDDIKEWKVEADKLLDHVRRVMSISSAAILSSPISKFYGETELELTAYSQSEQTKSSMRITHFLNQQPFFEAAVTSFFNPPIEVKNLFFAIEWFAMDAKHNEVRLLNAMTVIENLVASNLDESASQILPTKEFDKTRKVLRGVIRDCINHRFSEDEELTRALVEDFNERLNDLNRRSIIDKLNGLIGQWGVPLDGISKEQIKAAKRARDLIVHRGHYYDHDDHYDGALWDHFTLIRELVVRILFTALGYRGQYISYVGGTKHVNFPPNSVRVNPSDV